MSTLYCTIDQKENFLNISPNAKTKQFFHSNVNLSFMGQKMTIKTL